MKKIKPIYTGVKEIADRLKLARKKSGYKNRRQFALKNGIPPTTYQKHESGERNILAPSIINYCKLLNISLVWLLTGDEYHKNKGFDVIEVHKTEKSKEKEEQCAYSHEIGH